MRTLLGALLVVPLVLGVAPSSGAGTPEPRPLRSFAFSADCTDVPGRLSVRQRSAGADRSGVAVRGTGLPTGLRHGQVYWRHGGSRPIVGFAVDPAAHRFRYRTSVDEPLTSGRVEAGVWNRDSTRRCFVGGSWRPRFVSIGSSSSAGFDAKLWKGRGEVSVNVNDVRCRPSEVVRARVVMTFADRTVRTRFGPFPCREGADSFGRAISARRLPVAMRVVARSGDRTWHAAYRLDLARSARLGS